MTERHEYKKSQGGYFYIDGVRVSEDRYHVSRKRSENVATQVRYEGGKFGHERKQIQVIQGAKIEREVTAPSAPKVKSWVIRGTGRPKSITDARTDKLVTDHFVESQERVGNIDAQEENLNEKYPDWVHFDTYIEEVEE